MNIQFNNEVTAAILATRISIDSFTGNLCNYQDFVQADGEIVDGEIFAGEDCYASNYQKDVRREADIQAIRDLVANSGLIVVTYHDKGNGDADYRIIFTRQETGKWIKEVEHI